MHTQNDLFLKARAIELIRAEQERKNKRRCVLAFWAGVLLAGTVAAFVGTFLHHY